MAVETLSRIPAAIEAGATVRFASTGRFVPGDGASLKLYLNNGAGTAPEEIEADEVDGAFVFTIDATETAAIVPGAYTWGEIYTDDDEEVTVGNTGAVEILPGLLTATTPTTAQAMVTGLQTAMAALRDDPNESVSFNGQSYTNRDTTRLREDLVFWQSRVIVEQQRIAAFRGNSTGGEVGVEFVKYRP